MPTFRDIAIVGGGCYGSFYATQLLTARARGAASWRRLLVVDRDPHCRAAGLDGVTLVTADWNAFFDDFLGDPASREGDAIVPSPLMPHLMADWIVRRAETRWPGRRVVREPAAVPLDTPFESAAPDGTRYVSFADWLCPVHCIEPATCPETRAPRTWEMAEHCAGWAEAQGFAGAALFVCRHRVFGVGMFDVSEVLEGDRLLAAAGAATGDCRVLIGTVSRCHGAVTVLHVGPEDAIRP